MNATKPQFFEMLGGRLEQVMSVRDHGDAVLFRTAMQPGRLVPLHSHIDPEGFYVLAGEIEVFVIDDHPKWQSVSAGFSLIVEDGIRHALRNNSSKPADLIVVTNRRLADYFHQAGRQVEPGQASTPPTRDDMEHMIRVTEEFGYWITSPEESEALIAQSSDRIHPKET